MTVEDVFQVVRANIAAMTRFSIDQITGGQRLSDVDIGDDLSITELETRTFKSLNSREKGALDFGIFTNLMDISASSTVSGAAQSGLQAYQGAFREKE